MFSKISIIAIGKTQKEFLDIEKHYKKLIKTKLEEEYITPLSHLPPHEQIEKESENLFKKGKKSEFIISMDKDGIMLSSEEFASNLMKISQNNKSISFLIGGSHGLSENIKKSSNLLISFSKLTFPHQVARMILLEQIYRAETIFSGNHYHK